MLTDQVPRSDERAPAELPRPHPVRGEASPERRKRRRLYYAVALLLLVAAGVGTWRWRAGRQATGPQLETARVDRGRIVAKVTATGVLSAIVTVQVGSQVSGRIQALYADFNSRVKKGQLIARIDPELFLAARDQARANLVAAQGNLAKAKAQAVDAQRQYARSRTLAEQKLVATADMETAQATAEAAQAAVQAAQGTVEQARASLHQAEVNLAYTDIHSPTNGVVISRSVDVGQTVAASLQAPTIFVIAEDLAQMQVDTSVAEADVGRLRDGMDATFSVDAYPAEVFRGRVRQIRNAPQTVQNVVTYDAVIDVPNQDLKLRPGMTANVTFVYAEKDDALRVPNAALRFRPPPELLGRSGAVPAAGAATPGGGAGARGAAGAGARRDRPGSSGRPDQRTVWVAREGKPVAVSIKTGISDGSVTEVVEGGLAPGDAVITDVSGGAATTPGGGMPGALRRPF